MDIRELAANNPAPPPGFDPENAQNLEDVSTTSFLDCTAR
jgi:hypothetical protein